MFDEFKELLSAFNEFKVKYLIIGGYAFGLHAQPRATKDLDLFIQPDAENAKVAFAALAKFGAPLEGLRPEDLIEQDAFFRMGVAPIAVDILPAISGIDFAQAWQRRVESMVDLVSGMTAPFISCEDLITNKLSAGRPQDLVDVSALREAEQARAELHQQEQLQEQIAREKAYYEAQEREQRQEPGQEQEYSR